MSNKLTHLQMIQSVISRMAGNSFLLKGWSVTLVSAFFALAANKPNAKFDSLAFFPVIMFWTLDGYFLRQERLFRKLYEKVRKLSENDIDFSMKTIEFESQVESWLCTCLSVTLRIFHGTVLLSVIIIIFILKQ